MAGALVFGVDGLELPGAVDALGQSPAGGTRRATRDAARRPKPSPSGRYSPMYGAVIRVRPGGGGVEDVAGRVVVERRPHRVSRDVVVGVSHDPDVGAGDSRCRCWPCRRGLVSRSGSGAAVNRSPLGAIRYRPRFGVAGVDDVDRDVEAIQVGGVGDRDRDRECRAARERRSRRGSTRWRSRTAGRTSNRGRRRPCWP